jgi:hypothetical protein
MSLYNIYENTFETLIPEYNNETDNEIEDNELEESINFTLDAEYLERTIEKLYNEDSSETDSIFSDDSDDVILGTDLNDLIIEQKESKILTRCVIIDKIDGCIKRCENLKSFRTLWQLCGVWQIDKESIIEADGALERLGVCNYHFNHDQNYLHDPGFKKKKNINQSIIRHKRCLFCGKLYYFFT